jgi:hypothetical protein
MHTTTTTAACPGSRKPFRARNTAIAAVGVVSAVMVAVGVAIGGKPTPPHTQPPRPRAHQASPRILHKRNAPTGGGR